MSFGIKAWTNDYIHIKWWNVLIITADRVFLDFEGVLYRDQYELAFDIGWIFSKDVGYTYLRNKTWKCHPFVLHV